MVWRGHSNYLHDRRTLCISQEVIASVLQRIPSEMVCSKNGLKSDKTSFAFQLYPAEEKTVWVDYAELEGLCAGNIHDKIAERRIPQTVLRHGKLLRMMVEGMSNSISLTLMVDYQLQTRFILTIDLYKRHQIIRNGHRAHMRLGTSSTPCYAELQLRDLGHKNNWLAWPCRPQRVGNM